MSSKTMNITGWILTIILGTLFLMSAAMKLTVDEATLASSSGLSVNTYRIIAIVEIFSLILFIIPRTGIVGTLLLVAYLGGAIVSHLLNQESIAMAVSTQIVLWITALIRFPELKHRLFTK